MKRSSFSYTACVVLSLATGCHPEPEVVCPEPLMPPADMANAADGMMGCPGLLCESFTGLTALPTSWLNTPAGTFQVSAGAEVYMQLNPRSYSSATTPTVQLPKLDIGNATKMLVSFRHRYELNQGIDRAEVQLYFGSGAPITLGSISGQVPTWSSAVFGANVDTSKIPMGMRDKVQIHFKFIPMTLAGTPAFSWDIDDLIITAIP